MGNIISFIKLSKLDFLLKQWNNSISGMGGLIDIDENDES